MKRGMLRIFISIFISLLLSCAVLNAQESRPLEEELISLNFDKVDIRVVIKFISELTGKNFLIDDKLAGTVTVVCPTKISISEIYNVLQSMLEVKGFTTVPAGNIIKILPLRDAQQKDIEVSVGKDLSQISREDRIITQIIPLDYVDVSEAVNLISPLKSSNTKLIISRPSNSFILTDTSSNIQRLVKIIKEIDNQLQEQLISVVPLKFASSRELSAELKSLIQARVKPGRKVSLFANQRTNSLIVVANKEDSLFLKDLIVKELDQLHQKHSRHIPLIYQLFQHLYEYDHFFS